MMTSGLDDLALVRNELKSDTLAGICSSSTSVMPIPLSSGLMPLMSLVYVRP